MDKHPIRFTLSQRREMTTISNRRFTMTSDIQKKRDNKGEQRVLTERVKNINMVVVFQNLIRENHSASDFFNLLVELRKMSSCDNFHIPDEVLSKEFSYFFSELLTYAESEIVYEATWCMINFYMEENFRESDNVEIFLTIEKLLTTAKIPVLIHVFRIFLHMSSYKRGADLLISRLNFKEVENVLKAEPTLAIPFFRFSIELINVHHNINYFTAEMILFITLRILEHYCDDRKQPADLTWGIRTIDAYLYKVQVCDELDENVKELVVLGFFDTLFKIGLRTFDKPTFLEKSVNDAIVHLLITISLVEDGNIIEDLFISCPDFFHLLVKNIADGETMLLKSPIFRFYNNLMLLDKNYCTYILKSGIYAAAIEILTIPNMAKMSTLLSTLDTFYLQAPIEYLESVNEHHGDIVKDLFTLLRRDDIIFESCKSIFGILYSIISRDINSNETREAIRNNGDFQQALEEYFGYCDDSMDDAELNDFIKSITYEHRY